MSKVLVIIPAYNEESNIERVLRHSEIVFKELEKSLKVKLDILVVDDGSEDLTLKKVQNLGVSVVSHPFNLGYWLALQTGMLFGYQVGYDYFVTMDADEQHPPEEVYKILFPLIKKEADVVIGACLERGSTAKKAAWNFFRFLTGLKVQDLTSGFRAYNRAAVSVLTSKNYSIFENADIVSLLVLKKYGFKVIEVPVKIKPRGEGVSKLFSSPFKIGYYLLCSLIISLAKRSKK